MFFDATGTISTGTTRAFHELAYQWNFGDGMAVWDPTGQSKNLAQGAVAAHVFESPGTYTVTLTVTDGVNNAPTTATITVQDPNTVFAGTLTLCVSASALPVAGVGGCPAGADVMQSNSFETIVNTKAQTTKRVLLKRGDVFTGGTANAWLGKTGPGILGAYGTGAKPVIQITDSNRYSTILTLYRSDDWRVMDLDFNGQSAIDLSLISANGDYIVSRLLMLRIDAHDLNAGIVMDSAATAVPDQVFLVDSTIKRIRSVSGGGGGGEATYWTGRRIGVLGNVIDDTTQGAFQLLRVNFADHAVFSHNLLQNSRDIVDMMTVRAPDSQPNLARSCTGCGTGDAAATKFVVVSRNIIKTNSNSGLNVDAGGVAEVTTGLLRDVVVEGNWFPTQPTGGFCIGVRATRVTVRNNICDLSAPTNSQIAMRVTGPLPTQPLIAASDVWVYNNTVYSGGAQPNMILTSIQNPPVSNLTVRNNIVYGASSTTAYIVTNGGGSTFSQDTNGIGNPSFANLPAASPPDFRLNSGSYAIGSGAAVPVFTDHFGQPRQPGSALDVGAILPR